MVEAEHPTLLASFTAQLRNDLEHGVFGPGERLVETKLTARYAVSRPTVRAAIQELARLGLVTRAPGRGSIVTAIDLEEARALLTLRSHLEPKLVQRFVERASSAHIDLFIAAAQRLRVSVLHEHDFGHARRALDAFYNALLGGADSWVLANAVEVQHAMLLLYRSRACSADFEERRLAASVEAHSQFIPVMLRRDAATAQSVCARHLHADSVMLLRHVSVSPPPPGRAPGGGGGGPGGLRPRRRHRRRRCVLSDRIPARRRYPRATLTRRARRRSDQPSSGS